MILLHHFKRVEAGNVLERVNSDKCTPGMSVKHIRRIPCMQTFQNWNNKEERCIRQSTVHQTTIRKHNTTCSGAEEHTCCSGHGIDFGEIIKRVQLIFINQEGFDFTVQQVKCSVMGLGLLLETINLQNNMQGLFLTITNIRRTLLFKL